MKNQKNIKSREQLRPMFKKGQLPGEDAFGLLIDSTFNKADDNLDIDEKDGLLLYPTDEGKLLSFFEDKDESEAKWSVSISKKSDGGILIRKNPDVSEKNSDEKSPELFLSKEDGKIGMGTNKPEQKLDIRGIIASQGRLGNFYENAGAISVDADGKWHNIFKTNFLDGCNAFEIMAYAEGNPGEGRYAMLHAIAICTYGNSKSKITKTSACFGKRWNRIDARWVSRPSEIEEGSEEKPKKKVQLWSKIKSLFESKDISTYNLQLRTKSNYGKDKKITVKIALLWEANFTNTMK